MKDRHAISEFFCAVHRAQLQQVGFCTTDEAALAYAEAVHDELVKLGELVIGGQLDPVLVRVTCSLFIATERGVPKSLRECKSLPEVVARLGVEAHRALLAKLEALRS